VGSLHKARARARLAGLLTWIWISLELITSTMPTTLSNTRPNFLQLSRGKNKTPLNTFSIFLQNSS
jgi:hypothetical protein